jgi:hypothetical protein
LSREVVAGLKGVVHSIDPFGPDLQELQKADEHLIKINFFQKDGKWPLNTTKAKQRLLLPVTNSLFLDSKAIWVWLTDENYPRTALWLPKIYRKRAICEVYGTILSGHDALKKTYLRLTNAYFWPNMKKTFKPTLTLVCNAKSGRNQLQNRHRYILCQQWIKTSAQGNKMVLVMTDTFTKYAEVIAIPNKEAETVAMEIIIHWICRFGSPIQIHSDNGTEFVNKLNKELFKLINIKHTTTTPGHPQCNAQAEVFKKTMAKYLTSFADESTLD